LAESLASFRDEVPIWADKGRISNAQARKILESNSKAFYGL
jgi:hypothetical protein